MMSSSRRSFFSLFAGGVAVAAIAQVKAAPAKIDPVEYDFGGNPFPPVQGMWTHQHGSFGTESANHTHQYSWDPQLPNHTHSYHSGGSWSAYQRIS